MSDRSTILFYLPRHVQQRCFRQADLARLEARCRLISHRVDTADALPAVWHEYAGEADIVVTGWETPPLTADMLETAPRLKLLVHAAGSVRHLVPQALYDRGIRVASANGALARGVAETVLGLIIVGLKGIIPASRLVADGGWKNGDYDAPGVRVRETFGSTIGIIGAGQVGRCLIELLRPFSVHVLVTDPYLSAHDAEALGVTRVELPALLERSDVVSLSAPSLPATRRMIGARELALLKDGAIFINTARGALVDEAALVAELRRERIWAFLDVTDPEPPAVDHPLRTLPNAVITPHLAGALTNGCLRLGADVADQLLAFLAGEPMHGEITPEQRAILA